MSVKHKQQTPNHGDAMVSISTADHLLRIVKQVHIFGATEAHQVIYTHMSVSVCRIVQALYQKHTPHTNRNTYIYWNGPFGPRRFVGPVGYLMRLNREKERCCCGTNTNNMNVYALAIQYCVRTSFQLPLRLPCSERNTSQVNEKRSVSFDDTLGMYYMKRDH